MAPSSNIEDRLTREIFESERTRLLMLAALSGALVAIFPALVLAFRREDSARIFGTSWALQVLGVFVLLAAYELTARHVIGRRLAQGKTLPRPMRFVNACVETSVPSLLIVLSAFTGIVAAVEYVLLCAWFVRESPLASGTLFALPPFYIAKGVALVLAGFAAGFVANQIKRRVRRVLRAHEERQRIVSAFGQQVSPAIVDELLKQGAAIPSKRTFVCVLFMDIRNFTRHVEKKTPEEFVAYQNAVFGAAIEAVDRHHGVINQFLGDGFMATFGAPVTTGHDCRNALGAARELLEAVKTLADSGRIPPTTIGLGLHAGEAVTGNIGSAARQQYSISGNVVILAARIEQLNKVYGSQLLVSAEVLREAGEAVSGAEALGPVQVKGRDEPIEIYRLA